MMTLIGMQHFVASEKHAKATKWCNNLHIQKNPLEGSIENAGKSSISGAVLVKVKLIIE